jgi:hypothetical protein
MKISGLPEITNTITDDGYVPVVQDGTTYKINVGNLKGKFYVRATWFEAISTTSGTISVVSNGEFVEDNWREGIDILTTELGSDGYPTIEIPEDSQGNPITAILVNNSISSFSYQLSGQPVSGSIGLIYCYRTYNTTFDESKTLEEITIEHELNELHNDIKGLQGGTLSEYYHVTQDQNNWIGQDLRTTASPQFESILSTTATFGSNPDYANFNDNGFLTFAGNGCGYTDIDFPIIIRTIGPNIPVITNIVGNLSAPQWQINDYSVCEGQELIHSWEQGTDGYFHIHVYTGSQDVTNTYLKFEIEWGWTNVHGVLSSSVITSPELLIPANTPIRSHLIFSIATVPFLDGRIAGHIKARLRRVDAIGIPPSGNPWCEMLQLHIKNNTIGSREIISK